MSLLNYSRKASMSFDCAAGILYDVLTDYDGYAEWLPRVAQSKLLAQERDLALAEFEVNFPPKKRFVIECVHTRNKMVLWRSIGEEIPVWQVEWTIAAAGDNKAEVTLVVSGRCQRNSLLPKYRRFLEPKKCMTALQSQVSAFLPELAVTDEEGEKIFELVETGDGIVCWVRGKKYVLKPESE
jgi:ribosome-associated toxin RatA of RatAB toxin-antitoxin module